MVHDSSIIGTWSAFLENATIAEIGRDKDEPNSGKIFLTSKTCFKKLLDADGIRTTCPSKFKDEARTRTGILRTAAVCTSLLNKIDSYHVIMFKNIILLSVLPLVLTSYSLNNCLFLMKLQSHQIILFTKFLKYF